MGIVACHSRFARQWPLLLLLWVLDVCDFGAVRTLARVDVMLAYRVIPGNLFAINILVFGYDEIQRPQHRVILLLIVWQIRTRSCVYANAWQRLVFLFCSQVLFWNSTMSAICIKQRWWPHCGAQSRLCIYFPVKGSGTNLDHKL